MTTDEAMTELKAAVADFQRAADRVAEAAAAMQAAQAMEKMREQS